MNAKSITLSLMTLFCYYTIFSQVGIGNTSPQAMLDISASSTSSPANNDGILIPRMNNFPSSPGAIRDGMLIFYSGTGASGKGFYFWDQAIGWTFLSGAKRIDELLDGKSDNDGTQNGSSVFLGIDAGSSDDSSDNRNVGVGYLAMEDNTTGSQNTAIGYHALLNNVDGNNNTAVGYGSLDANVDGIWNTGLGQTALSGNIGGSYNTAVGKAALAANSDGNSNVALGVNAIQGNTSGSFNTVIGVDAATGLNASNNTIIGRRAMNSYSAGGENVAIGAGAGYYGSGIQNTYIGTIAGNSLGTGERNGSVFLGYGAGSLEAFSNRLYIENSTSTTPLIYGEFDNDILRFNAAVAIGTTNPDNSSVLDITSNQKGILIPRMTALERLSISAPVDGLMVYQTNDVKGLYFYDGTSWDRMLKESRDLVPTGAVFSFPIATAPSGYLICDGSAVSRTTYADLFALIGVTYGNGNGSTTFNLPDYRGKFLRGSDNGAGNDPDALTRLDRGDGTTGDAVGTNQNGEFASHLHQIDPPSSSSSTNGNHFHSTNSTNVSTFNNGNHNHYIPSRTVLTNSSGNHSHTIRGNEESITSFGSSDFIPDDNGTSGPDSINTSANGNHTHTVNIPSTNTNSGGNHNHTVSIPVLTTNSFGDHAHTTDIPVFDSSTTGSSENRPVNISVIYCIKY